MSKKHKAGPAPIPPGNKPRNGVAKTVPNITPPAHGEPLSEQDASRRLGNFTTAGEHAIEQPSGKKGSDH